ncbi:MAG: DUF1329 domain-containing protein [Desulfobacterales bacterium]|nr:DUF1329 domain-containing protein [Desulfobacterales bacterium]
MMKRIVTISMMTMLMFALSMNMTLAKVSEQEVQKLNKELTPMGSVRQGNAEGTIPEWTGGVISPPSEYKTGMYHPYPFKKDEKILTITKDNVDQLKEKLTPGQLAMFKTYPNTYKMYVYPTHRTASYPKDVYDAFLFNASNAIMINDGNGFNNARMTSPFPMPQNGLEAIWNHIARFRGVMLARYGSQAAPAQDGSYTIMKMEELAHMVYATVGLTAEQLNEKNMLIYFKQWVTAPARLAGTALLVHEFIDQIKQPRQAWTYNAGQRRVRRAPDVAYDSPGTAADGLRTTDDFDVFCGAPDRYTWTLVGKKEIYIPYNDYTLHSNQLKNDDIIKAGHINQEHARYELHRVWVVEANLKQGIRHLYKKRVFYLDEDSWQAVLEDIYDDRDQLWRVYEAHPINYYEIPMIWTTLDVIYDLQAGRYLAGGLDNETKPPDFSVKLDENEFTPASLRRSGH